MTLKERMEDLDVVKMVAEEALGNALAKANDAPFGFGFLWVQAVIGGVGYKFLAGSIPGCTGWNEIVSEVKSSCPEIQYAWVNPD
jgi:hypothetical protein